MSELGPEGARHFRPLLCASGMGQSVTTRPLKTAAVAAQDCRRREQPPDSPGAAVSVDNEAGKSPTLPWSLMVLALTASLVPPEPGAVGAVRVHVAPKDHAS